VLAVWAPPPQNLPGHTHCDAPTAATGLRLSGTCTNEDPDIRILVAGSRSFSPPPLPPISLASQPATATHSPTNRLAELRTAAACVLLPENLAQLCRRPHRFSLHYRCIPRPRQTSDHRCIDRHVPTRRDISADHDDLNPILDIDQDPSTLLGYLLLSGLRSLPSVLVARLRSHRQPRAVIDAARGGQAPAQHTLTPCTTAAHIISRLGYHAAASRSSCCTCCDHAR
jgi:hypothetical protein